jgi:hypothetical protein
MSTPTKREFNALIIGLSLGLGMSITISLEAMAVEIRYWILGLRNWPDREVGQALHHDVRILSNIEL